MFSKSISSSIDMFPHVGIGRSEKCLNALTRISVIHSGSSFSSEICLTTSSESPKSNLIVEFSGSCQPALYSPTASLASLSPDTRITPPSAIHSLSLQVLLPALGRQKLLFYHLVERVPYLAVRALGF